MLVKGELSVELAGRGGKATLRFTEREREIHIDTVFVPVVGRGSGVGTALIRRVFQLADAAGVAVVLEAHPIGSRGPDSVARLVRYYERLGFTVVDRQGISSASPAMSRAPGSGPGNAG